MTSLLLVHLLLLGARAADTTADTWRRCTGLLPLDLLSFVLQRNPSKPITGVQVEQAGGVRGVHFPSPHPSMSFPSSQLLGDCDLFPEQFSIVVTLRVTSVGPKEPKQVETTGGGEEEEEDDKDYSLERNKKRTVGEVQRHGEGEKKSRVTAREEHGRVLLGLRLSKERLHFLFRGHGGVVEQSSFRGAGLADDQWHTVVLSVGSHRVRLTVDCNTPLEMVCCASWFWCLVWTPPISFAPLRTPDWQFCQYHHFCPTCMSRGGGVMTL
ncbi:Thrombospondin-type laminin G domain and EAR repeat-containing protein [Liparis tanakae]|uniref:Thrombospondin-type laminin G domain and EAR repeat-containing protein n=1 Tax=Liparis tanakae TaxID=230148 RepID=A0A4Z2G7I4_9TELE|nr:Thrombospondin-type laminin G domain and EAR repeat-containing protein [Liparis tanakae]